MRHSFSIYFYLKRRKLQKDSKSTIMLRIIVNNKAADVSLKISILQEHWDKQNRRVSDLYPGRQSEQSGAALAADGQVCR